ncbi:glutamate--cysteine ligase, partial [Coemansia sp. RSA 2618]
MQNKAPSFLCWIVGNGCVGEPPYLRAFSLERLALQTTQCLQERRRILKSRLNPDEMLLSISQFPLLGAGTYIDHQGPPGGPLLRSQLLPDICLNPLPPFTLEIGGIIDRRGIVPYTGIPVFRDTNTAWPFVDEDLPADPYKSGILMQPGDSGRDSACSMTSPSTAPAAVANVTPTDDAAAAADLIARGLFLDSLPRPLRLNTHTMATLTTHSRPLLIDPPSNKNCVLLDSPLFGIGSGGVLRVTLCAADLNEARLLHDQLAPISAIMAALTAATPIVKGHLVNRDCYWDVQCGTVDDRSAQERGIAPLTTAKGTLLKSRYGSIDMYLGPDEARPDPIFRRQYNDCHFTYDKQSFWKMREDNGIDYLLALHVSRLFVRDIHYASEYMLSSSSGGSSSSSGGGGNNNSSNNSSAGGNMNGQEHFKRFLGCSRQNICLYPPNKCTGSGWEVEFMSLEAQLTDAENAA